MIESRLGEFAALLTAVFWTVCALYFESATKRIGVKAVNMIRLCLGMIFLCLYTYISRGMFFPFDATLEIWFWLSISGVIGLALGDQLLLVGFIKLGARISMLIMASVPPITALLGWIFLGETLSPLGLIGMVTTITGISLVVLERNPKEKQFKLTHSIAGILYALGGALGQSVGLILTKFGLGDYDPFQGTQIRVLAAIVGFSIFFFITRSWSSLGSAFKDRRAMYFTSMGAIFGPFLGVSFSLLAIQYTTTGVASTIMAIVPVLIIPPAVIFFKEKITVKEVIGAVIAVLGVGLLFL